MRRLFNSPLLGTAGVLLLCLTGASGAQDRTTQVVPLKVLDGHLLVQGKIRAPDGLEEAITFEISLECQDTLRISNSSIFEWLEMNWDQNKHFSGLEKGESMPVTLTLLPGVEAVIPGREITEENLGVVLEAHQDLIWRYPEELKDVGVAGTLGVEFLKRYRVVLDVAAGEMRLSMPRGDSPPQGDIVQSLEIKDARLWIPVSYGADRQGAMMLAGFRYDSFVNTTVTQGLERPYGDIAPVWLSAEQGGARADLSQYVAFRPLNLVDDNEFTNDRAAFLFGFNLLQSFRIEIDWVNSKIAFTASAKPEYPRTDFEFFRPRSIATPARCSGSSNAIPATGCGGMPLDCWRHCAPAIRAPRMSNC
jgi:hypothetical protein